MSARLFTSESVTEGHPDKICDQISDSILDAMLAQDPRSRVAVETMVTTGLVHVAGEVTTEAYVEIPKIVRDTVARHRLRLLDQGLRRRAPAASRISIGQQSPRHRPGRRHRVREPHRRRRPARQAGRRRPGPDVRLRLRRHPRADAAADLPGAPAGRAPDRGAQERRAAPTCAPTARPRSPSATTATARSGSTPSSLSTQHAADVSLDGLLEPDIAAARHQAGPRRAGRRRHRPATPATTARCINPTGRFEIGGPMGDAGLTGRKIIVDTYGGMARHGGGAFSGKDPSKVDRSAAYAMRWVAKNVVAAGPRPPLRGAGRLRHRQGAAGRPVRRDVRHRDRPRRTRSRPRSPRSSTCGPPRSSTTSTCCARSTRPTAAYGHFGRTHADGVDNGFTWERTDRVEAAAGAPSPADAVRSRPATPRHRTTGLTPRGRPAAVGAGGSVVGAMR